MKQHNAGSLGKIADMPSQTLRNQLQCTFSSMTGGQSADCSKTWACAPGSPISWRAWPRTGPVLPGTWTQTFSMPNMTLHYRSWPSMLGTTCAREHLQEKHRYPTHWSPNNTQFVVTDLHEHCKREAHKRTKQGALTSTARRIARHALFRVHIAPVRLRALPN